MIHVEKLPKSYKTKVIWTVTKFVEGCMGAVAKKEYKKSFQNKKSAISFAKVQVLKKSDTVLVGWKPTE